MRTQITVLHPSGHQVKTTVELPERPKYGDLSNVMRRFLGEYTDHRGQVVSELMEHATALVDGEKRDMFICQLGGFKMKGRPPLPVNDQATTLYRRPGVNGLTHINGPAVLFERKVWPPFREVEAVERGEI